MKRYLFLTIFILFSTGIRCLSQAPSVLWEQTYGGEDPDQGNSINKTLDGGYIIAGWSQSEDGDVSEHHGAHAYEDFWAVKLDSSCDIVWEESPGGSYVDIATSVSQTVDSGFIVGGYTESTDGDVTGNHGDYFDFWIVKLDRDGAIIWQKCLGGTEDDMLFSIHQTDDGGYIAVGNSYSVDGDVTGNHGNADYWVVKLDSGGNIEWQKSLGGSSDDLAQSVEQTADGGYIVVGYTLSTDGDVTGFHGTFYHDYWVVKLDAYGNLEWQKCLGGSGYDFGHSVTQINDGGFIVAGQSDSNDGDVSGNHGSEDAWIVRLDAGGNIKWQKSVGGSGYDIAYEVRQVADGNLVMCGITASNDGDFSDNHGNVDGFLVKLDTSGNILWQECLGGTENEVAYSFDQDQQGSFIVAGNISGYAFINDVWVAKTAPEVSICGAPSAPAVSEVTSSSARLSWNTGTGGIKYKVRYKISSTDSWNVVAAGKSSKKLGSLLPDTKYTWQVKSICEIDPIVSSPWTSKQTFTTSGLRSSDIEQEVIEVYPSPFTISATVSFMLQQSSAVEINLFDLNGQKIKVLVNEKMEAGNHEIQLDRGKLSSGIYFLIMRTDERISVLKIVID